MKKTAIVTGARRGIGLAIAKKLLEGGYRVVLCATTAAGEVTALLEELNRLGEAYYLRCDISRPEDRDNLLDQVLEAFYRIRSLPQIKKKPSTSEIIDWIQALVHGGVDPRRVVKEVPYLGVLLKKNEDMDALRRNWR